jgi:hypothetical protein
VFDREVFRREKTRHDGVASGVSGVHGGIHML